jgi:two-component system chemotaxis sensor kinase CheA
MAVTPQVITVILEAVDVVKTILRGIRETGSDAHVGTEAIATKLDLIMEVAGDTPATPPPAEAPASPGESRPAADDAAAEPQKLGEILIQDGLVSKEQLLEALDTQEQAPPLGQVLLNMHAINEQTLDQALKKQQAGPAKKSEDEQTIRVDTKRLDHVMNLVGELVLGRNRLMKIGTGLDQQHENDPAVREMSDTLAQLNLVTTDLQLAVMKTRMLPIRKVLAKFPRMVRDLAQKLRKQVRLELHGEETELDKSVADEIGDPLVHLVRNAVDHGLESPDERSAAGKPVEGTVRIAACQEGNSIVIRIEDDGHGLQIDKIKAKALSKGLVSQHEMHAMDARQVMNLIFLPGFSTAEQVTDVSGRGVGMDVVRTNIRRLNGTVTVESDPGRGSAFIIKLPLTIAIIQALLVEVEQSFFAIPLGSVIEAVKITRADIKTINGQEVLNLRDCVLPLLRLTRAFDLPEHPDRDEFYVVVAALGDRRVGVVVDHLRSQEEVVIKSLGDYLTDIKGIAGATITGEGKVVLILDVGELLQNVQGPMALGMTA